MLHQVGFIYKIIQGCTVNKTQQKLFDFVQITSSLSSELHVIHTSSLIVQISLIREGNTLAMVMNQYKV
jgi:hypothetical protein